MKRGIGLILFILLAFSAVAECTFQVKWLNANGIEQDYTVSAEVGDTHSYGSASDQNIIVSDLCIGDEEIIQCNHENKNLVKKIDSQTWTKYYFCTYSNDNYIWEECNHQSISNPIPLGKGWFDFSNRIYHTFAQPTINAGNNYLCALYQDTSSWFSCSASSVEESDAIETDLGEVINNYRCEDSGWRQFESNCFDNRDNNGNGLIDCQDNDCIWTYSSSALVNSESICYDNIKIICGNSGSITQYPTASTFQNQMSCAKKNDGNYYFFSCYADSQLEISDERKMTEGAIVSTADSRVYLCEKDNLGNGKWKVCATPGETYKNQFICEDNKWKSIEICDDPNENDEDQNGDANCYDSICKDEFYCWDQKCSQENDDLAWIWSYSLPTQSSVMEQSQPPNSYQIGCCDFSTCAYNNQCYNSGDYLPQHNEYICNQENNWIKCTADSYYQQFNSDKTKYCNGAQWYEVSPCTAEQKGKLSLINTEQFYCNGESLIPLGSCTKELFGTISQDAIYCNSSKKWALIETDCTNGIDDGGEPNFADCLDISCNNRTGSLDGQKCEYKKELTCNDKFDNDADLKYCNSYCQNELLRCKSNCQDYDCNLNCIMETINCAQKCELELENKKGTDCSDSDCLGKTGHLGATCCLANNDCSTGAICGVQKECQETICSDNKDNDRDDLIDCLDPDCENLVCSGSGINAKTCQKEICKEIPKAPTAPIYQVKKQPNLFSYQNILELIKQCRVVKQSGNCNEICQSQNKICIFAEGGRKACNEESSKCTCC